MLFQVSAKILKELTSPTTLSLHSLPYFGQLLDLSFKMGRYQNWTNSILDVMENFAAVSEDNLEKVVGLLRPKAVGEQTWLNRIIEEIRYKFLESQYKCMLVRWFWQKNDN